MKALVYTDTKKMALLDIPTPDADPTDNVISVRSAGICGSDMHAYLGHDARRPAPLVLGHEAAGDVVAGPLAGKRVTINPLVTCQNCDVCRAGRSNLCANRQIISMPPRPGAFAETVVMPTRNLIEVPDNISFDHAALAEPLAVCWHSIRLGLTALNDSIESPNCLIIGGGAIGVGSALCLTAKGITNVTISEPNQMRRKYVADMCKFQTCDPTTQDEAVAQYDLVVDAVGIQATRANACRQTKPGGVIIHIGLGDNDGGLDIRRLTLQEIQFIGTYTYTDQDFHETAQAIFDGRLGALNWIETRPLADGPAAFNDILTNQVAAPKIILNP